MAAALVDSLSAQSSASGTLSITLDWNPADGNWLIAWVTVRSNSIASGPAGWTRVTPDVWTGSGSANGYGSMWVREAASEGATPTYVWSKGSSNPGNVVVAEFSGVTGIDVYGSLGSQAAATGPSITITPTAGVDVAIFAGFVVAIKDWETKSFTPGAGYTELLDAKTYGTSGPQGTVVYKLVSGSSGSYTPSTSTSVARVWGAIVAVLASAPTPPPDPEPGGFVDWDEDGFSSGDYDDIGQYIDSWRISQGQSAEITGGATPGTCSLILNNPADDRFNPLNSGGPLYGKLKDGVPLWIGVNNDGSLTGSSILGLFGGRIKDIIPKPEANGLGRVTKVEITGEDALARAGRRDITVEDAAFRTQQEFRIAVLGAAGISSMELDDEIHTIPLSGWDGSALAALEQLNRSNGTRHFVRPENSATDWYTYVTRNRQWRLDGTADYTLDAGTQHLTRTDGWRLSADTVINQQRVTVSPVTFSPSGTVVWQAEGLPWYLHPTRKERRIVWVEFDDYVADPILNLTYTGGTTGATIEAFGHTAKVTLVNGGFSESVITRLSIEGTIARRWPDESYVADNEASQAGGRGIRAGSDISGELVGLLESGTGLAQHVVWRYGDPQYRPTITIENWIPDGFEVRMFDTIAVTIDQLSMTSRLFEVVGRTLEGKRAASATVRHHTLTLVLQECAVQSDPGWFTWDISDWDGTDVLGY